MRKSGGDYLDYPYLPQSTSHTLGFRWKLDTLCSKNSDNVPSRKHLRETSIFPPTAREKKRNPEIPGIFKNCRLRGDMLVPRRVSILNLAGGSIHSQPCRGIPKQKWMESCDQWPYMEHWKQVSHGKKTQGNISMKLWLVSHVIWKWCVIILTPLDSSLLFFTKSQS